MCNSCDKHIKVFFITGDKLVTLYKTPIMKYIYVTFIALLFLLNGQAQSYITEYSLDTQPGSTAVLASAGCFRASDGKVWVKTNKAVFYYENGNLTEFNNQNSCIPFASNVPYPFTELNGSIYVSLFNKGIAKVYPNCELFSPSLGNFPQLRVQNLTTFNNLIYASTDSSLLWFDGQNYGEYTSSNSGLLSNQIVGVKRVGASLYILHPNSISIYNAPGWSYINSMPFVADLNTQLTEHAGYLWFTVFGKNYVYINNQWVYASAYFINDKRRFLDESVSLSVNPLNVLYAVNQTHLFNTATGVSYPITAADQSVIYNPGFKIQPVFINPTELVYTEGSKLKKIDLNLTSPFLYDSLFIYANFTNIQKLDINEVKCRINSGGSQFAHTGNDNFEVNALHTIYSSSLWISGKNTQTGQYHLSAEMFREGGKDFSPGPLDNTGQSSLMSTLLYDRVWKINRMEVANFIFHYNQGNVSSGVFQIPASILEWPGNGLSGLARAPFHDANNDNMYNPFDGDYPLMKGDQMIWWVYNDMQSPNRESGGIPLGLEIENIAYAFINDTATGTNDLINTTVFIEHIIKNKSVIPYDSVYIANFSDLDVGYADHNHFGSCVNSHSYYAYRSTIDDFPVPAAETDVFQAVILLKDGIHASADRELNGVGTFYKLPNNTSSDPEFPHEYMNMLRQTGWLNGLPMTYGMYGIGSPNGINTSFAFPGNSDPNFIGTDGIDPGFYWTALTPYPGNGPLPHRDVRGLGRLGPYSFPAGAEMNVAWAYTTFKKDSTVSQLDYILNDLCAYPPIIQNWYDNQTFPSGLYLGSLNVTEQFDNKVQLEVWPVPSSGMIWISAKGIEFCKSISIYNMQGMLVFKLPHCNSEAIGIDISAFSAGIYLLELKDEQGNSYLKKIIRN